MLVIFLQIQKLLAEKMDLLKSLRKKEEEATKLEAKLKVVQKERSCLETKATASEKQLAQLQKSNEVLKTKVNTLELLALFLDYLVCFSKKVNSVKFSLGTSYCF